MIHNKPLFSEMIIATVLVAVFHIIGINFNIYYILSWYDIFMHIFGGLTISFIFCFFYLNYYKKEPVDDEKIFILAVACVLIVGIGWEIFEFGTGLTGTTLYDAVDTAKDFLDDFLGAILGTLYFIKKNN
ncbi:hypothetical protein IT397_00110 [Candidatus Nomurabacteria bacterium]|nr:hypothetical protein [Candidatus Nomurabacteria bacterium]